MTQDIRVKVVITIYVRPRLKSIVTSFGYFESYLKYPKLTQSINDNVKEIVTWIYSLFDYSSYLFVFLGS